MYKKPKLALYWDTQAVIATPFFNATMSLDRFQLIIRFLHFSDNGQGSKQTVQGHDVLEGQAELQGV